MMKREVIDGNLSIIYNVVWDESILKTVVHSMETVTDVPFLNFMCSSYDTTEVKCVTYDQ